MPMAITVKAVLVANKGEAQAEERSDVFLFWLQVWLPINVPWAERRVAHGKVRPPCANK